MKKNRINKGKSIVTFPDSFVVIDIVVTGYAFIDDSIIEVAAHKYSNEEKIGEFSSLINPNINNCIDECLYDLTGITNEMLLNAPSPKEVFTDFFSFIGNDVVVGHCVNFDINFLYDSSIRYLNKPFTNDYIDTLRYARKLLPELSHHRIPDLCDYFKIAKEKYHRANSGCELSYQCYSNLLTLVNDKDAFINSFKKNRSYSRSSLKDLSPNTQTIDENNPFFNKTFVFTGKLKVGTRKELAQIVVDYGGFCVDTVSKKVNYLVIGVYEDYSLVKDGKSSKHKKAEKLKLNGCDIEIISENIFYDMLENCE
ncbi:MAG: exonuclease [Lachnospiraceae bacterium]|nr:exonuclease [Lachnospiraceae bacterium]